MLVCLAFSAAMFSCICFFADVLTVTCVICDSVIHNVVARPTLRLYCLISSVMKLLFKFGKWESLVQDDSNISIFFWIRIFLSDCMAFKKFEYFIQHSMFVYIYVILNFKLRAALFMSDCFKVIRNTRCSLFANASGVYTFSWRPFENILFTTIDPHKVCEYQHVMRFQNSTSNQESTFEQPECYCSLWC